jgi:hypothetical protein
VLTKGKAGPRSHGTCPPFSRSRRFPPTDRPHNERLSAFPAVPQFRPRNGTNVQKPCPMRLLNVHEPPKADPHRPHRKGQAQHVLRRCHRCRGTGRAPCQVCNGAGDVLRGRDLFGKAQYSKCGGCFGTRSCRCSTCAGLGWT